MILVADSTKFERSAPVRIGHVSQVDYVVTDGDVPEAFMAACVECDVRLETTGRRGRISDGD